MAAGILGAGLFLGQTARAEIDYEGIKYLGGGEKIDVNNANIRTYLRFPGFYPNLAAKIVNNGPYKSVGDLQNIPGLSGPEKDNLKKAEGQFTVLDVKPEYEIDKINNGMYR
jgi:photosystem II PsbU protein